MPLIAPDRRPPPNDARAETVATNGLGTTALSRQRCLMPARRFLGWAVVFELNHEVVPALLAGDGGVRRAALDTRSGDPRSGIVSS